MNFPLTAQDDFPEFQYKLAPESIDRAFGKMLHRFRRNPHMFNDSELKELLLTAANNKMGPTLPVELQTMAASLRDHPVVVLGHRQREAIRNHWRE